MLIRFPQQSRLAILNHFTDEETEAQSGCPACPRPQSWMVAELSLELGLLGFQAGPCNQEELPVSFHVGWELVGLLSLCVRGVAPRALAQLRGDPLREVEGAGPHSQEGASHPGTQLPCPHPHPSPSSSPPSPSGGRRLEVSRPSFRLGERGTVLGFGFPLWKWKLMLSGKHPVLLLKLASLRIDRCHQSAPCCC